MDRQDIDRVEELLRELKTLKRSVRRDFDRFNELLSELQGLVSEHSYLDRKVSSEVRYFNDLSARLREFSIYSAVQRRLPDLRRLVKEGEDQEDEVKKSTKKVTDKLKKLDRYLSNIG